jgi:glucose-6-phosphate 1-dehydrogenase
MNIDELIQAIRSISTEKQLLDLVRYIEESKGNDQNVNELEAMIEKFFGTTWLSTDEIHSQVYNLWNRFREDTIYKIDGMTMNERLYFLLVVY